MSTTSKRTKTVRTVYWVLWVVSLLLTIGPLIGYTIYGFIEAETKQKVVLSMTSILSIALGAFCALSKRKIRSLVWIVLIGLTVALNHITAPVLVIGICSTVDEFLVDPAVKHYRAMLISNKEIDKRGIE